MEPWMFTSLLLCIFGFVKEFRPSEPYFTQYLVGPMKNFTDTEVNQFIYPVITYSYLALLIIVFLVTDLLRYKVVIIVGGIAGVLDMVLIIVGKDIPTLQVVGFFGGMFYATEIAYFTYIYAKVDRTYYQKVTSHTQSSFLLGRFLSSVVGQLFVSLEIMNYHQLNYISLAALALATVWAFFLPSVKRSVYFHNWTDQSPTVGENAPPNPTFLQKCKHAYGLLWSHSKAAYTSWYVLKWSIWWALASCGFNQGYFYIQLLWDKVARDAGATEEDFESMYNGGVGALYTMIGAAGAFGSGWLRLNWQVLGEATLAVCAGMLGGALIVASHATNIWVAYISFIAFGVIYHTMFTIVNAEVAKHINEDSYGLVFGVNTFFALVFQSILTVILVSEDGLALGIRAQFMVYGCYFLVLGGAYVLLAIVSGCGGKMANKPLWLPKEAQQAVQA